MHGTQKDVWKPRQNNAMIFYQTPELVK